MDDAARIACGPPAGRPEKPFAGDVTRGAIGLNILFVADVSAAAVIGGAERVLYEQSSRLARRGHRIHILTRRRPEHSADRQILGDVYEWRYAIEARHPIAYLRSTRVNARRLFESLQAQVGFDCINFHQPFAACGVLASPCAQPIPKIYTCHSLSFEEFTSRNQRPAGFFSRRIHRLNILIRRHLEKRALEASGPIVALSRYTAEKLNSAYDGAGRRCRIIPGGVDLERFQPAADKTAIRRRLGLPLDRVLLLTVRNLVPRMGLDNLINAFRKLLPCAPDLFLVIGGDGPLKQSLADQIGSLDLANHVLLTGFLPEDRLPDYYRMADMFVLPTRELEGFGLVTLESMASGVPVLGTPVGGTREILDRFDPAFLFRDDQPDSLAALILEHYRIIRNHPERWRRSCTRCRDFVEKKFSWEKNVDGLEALFKHMSALRPARPSAALNHSTCASGR
jgi:glycosyltransferase involved in cell wall biosynthesis